MRPPVPDGVTFIDDDVEASESDLTESDDDIPEAFKTPAANPGQTSQKCSVMHYDTHGILHFFSLQHP